MKSWHNAYECPPPGKIGKLIKDTENRRTLGLAHLATIMTEVKLAISSTASTLIQQLSRNAGEIRRRLKIYSPINIQSLCGKIDAAVADH